MIESTFQTKFMHWFLHEENRFVDQVVFEPKVTKTNTFNLTQWRKKQPLQYVRLKDAAGEKGVFWKISDTDPRTKPWDCFFVANVPAFLVIYFDKYEHFFLISVYEIPKQTSLSYEECYKKWKPQSLLKLKRKVIEI